MVTNQEEDLRERRPFTFLSGQSGCRLTSPFYQSTAAAAAILAFCQKRPRREEEALLVSVRVRLRAFPLPFLYSVKSSLTPLGFGGVLVGSQPPHPSLRVDLGPRHCAVSREQPFPHRPLRIPCFFSPTLSRARRGCSWKPRDFHWDNPLSLISGSYILVSGISRAVRHRLVNESEALFRGHAFQCSAGARTVPRERRSPLQYFLYLLLLAVSSESRVHYFQRKLKCSYYKAHFPGNNGCFGSYVRKSLLIISGRQSASLVDFCFLLSS